MSIYIKIIMLFFLKKKNFILDYPFAKFDKPKNILIYTDKEYNKVLKGMNVKK